MDSYLFEVKSILRSILISSPVIIDVHRLNRDFKEQEGIAIPFEKFGHKSLLEFLKSIPDVLLVDGDSKYSEVTPINSKKSSHVNDLVMKQKISSKPGSFSSRKSRRNNRRSSRSEEMIPSIAKIKGNVRQDDGYFTYKTSSVASNNNMKEGEHEKTDYSKNMENKEQEQTENRTSSTPAYDTKFTHTNESVNKDRLSSSSLQNTFKPYSECKKNTKILTKSYSDKQSVMNKTNRTPYKNNENVDSPKPSTLFEMDVSLKGITKVGEFSYRRGGVKSVPNRQNETFVLYGKKEEIPQNRESNFFRGSMKRISTSNDAKDFRQKINEPKKSDKVQRKIHNYIPKKVQLNLQKLISDFPEGIYCSELPAVYKNLIGEELKFEDFGYMNLVYMCFDLNHIFHCLKDSLSDYKLYDARKPSPELNSSNIFEETFEEDFEDVTPEPTPAIPEMLWGSFETFLPEDAIKLGYEVEKIKVSDVFSAGISVNVTVADIYDISKFWIIVNCQKLDHLMDNMQEFYKDNKRYLVPQSLLEKGLCCVVLYKGIFHRAVILHAMLGQDNLKVYYFDFGTLGTVSKTEVWFLTRTFGELPRQAIRSRLADIYPPYSGVTWTASANKKFTELACMKKLVAKVERVDDNKNLVDIKLRDDHSYISDTLVDLGHAIFINQSPKKHVEDPNCIPRVQYPHLFPTFEEIEYGLVPSIPETDSLLRTSVTLDFLYSQYFKRTDYKELIESIESKSMNLLKKRKTLIKQIRVFEESLVCKSEDDMNMLVYGTLFSKKTPTSHDPNGDGFDQEQEGSNGHKEVFGIEDDGALIGLLRQKTMSKIKSLETKDVDILQTILDERNSAHSADLGSESNSSMNDHSYQMPNIIDCEDMSELKKFLSKKSSPEEINEPSTNLIDLDDCFSPLIPIEPSTNLLVDPEFAGSQLALERSKNHQRCLLTDFILTDETQKELESVLDEPIPEVKNPLPLEDLIQFEVDQLMSSLRASSGSEKNEGLKSEEDNKLASLEFDDADDEDSDSKLSCIQNHSIPKKGKKARRNLPNITKSTNSPKHDEIGILEEQVPKLVQAEDEVNYSRIPDVDCTEKQRKDVHNDDQNSKNVTDPAHSLNNDSQNTPRISSELKINEEYFKNQQSVRETPNHDLGQHQSVNRLNIDAHSSNVNEEHVMGNHNAMKTQNHIGHTMGNHQPVIFNHLGERVDMDKHTGTVSAEQSQHMRVMPFAAYFPVPVFRHSRVLLPFSYPGHNNNNPQVPNVPNLRMPPMPSLAPFSHQQQQILSDISRTHNNCPPVVIFNYNVLQQQKTDNNQ